MKFGFYRGLIGESQRVTKTRDLAISTSRDLGTQRVVSAHVSRGGCREALNTGSKHRRIGFVSVRAVVLGSPAPGLGEELF